MSYGPDLSGSDYDSDDCGYEDFKQKLKTIKSEPRLTESEKKQQEIKQYFNALYHNNIEEVVSFLSKGYDVNMELEDGWRPILLVASNGNDELLKLLIEHGADINSHKDHITALMMASSCPNYKRPFDKSLDIIKLLVNHGSNVSCVNRKRINAVMFACGNGNLDAVKYLLPLSDRNAKDNQNWSALFWAVTSNNPELVKFLIENNFDMNSVDVRGDTPLELARTLGVQSIINLFPSQETDTFENIFNDSCISFEKNFIGLNEGERAVFASDIYNILLAVKCQHLIKLFYEKNVKLHEFLSLSDDDLKNLGVSFPYQRRRLLNGLYRFHQHMYSSKSIQHIPLNEIYSNVDVATQMFTAIKQLVAMEASIKFIQKYFNESSNSAELRLIQQNIDTVRIKIRSCQIVVDKLHRNTIEWDRLTSNTDTITKDSISSKIPWRKILGSVSLISIALFLQLRNRHYIV